MNKPLIIYNRDLVWLNVESELSRKRKQKRKFQILSIIAFLFFILGCVFINSQSLILLSENTTKQKKEIAHKVLVVKSKDSKLNSSKSSERTTELENKSAVIFSEKNADINKKQVELNSKNIKSGNIFTKKELFNANDYKELGGFISKNIFQKNERSTDTRKYENTVEQSELNLLASKKPRSITLNQKRILEINHVIEPFQPDLDQLPTSVFVSMTIGQGQMHFDGTLIDNLRNSIESLDYLYNLRAGVQYCRNRTFVNIGLSVNMLQQSLQHRATGIISSAIVPVDITNITQEEKEQGARDVVLGEYEYINQTNRLYQFGVPISFGYNIAIGKVVVQPSLGFVVNFSQQFYGQLPGRSLEVFIDREASNEEYYKNDLGVNFTASLDIGFSLKSHTSLFSSIQYNNQGVIGILDNNNFTYSSLGIGIGLRWFL